jgi:hypothetical protein
MIHKKAYFMIKIQEDKNNTSLKKIGKAIDSATRRSHLSFPYKGVFQYVIQVDGKIYRFSVLSGFQTAIPEEALTHV